ncbi:hypothetical protein M0804_010354 [Polistes exclamans]|nr:hypothetical protein M0804_010354 [Polistes exclamans]
MKQQQQQEHVLTMLRYFPTSGCVTGIYFRATMFYLILFSQEVSYRAKISLNVVPTSQMHCKLEREIHGATESSPIHFQEFSINGTTLNHQVETIGCVLLKLSTLSYFIIAHSNNMALVPWQILITFWIRSPTTTTTTYPPTTTTHPPPLLSTLKTVTPRTRALVKDQRRETFFKALLVELKRQ